MIPTPDEIKKLINIANDSEFSSGMRIQAIKTIGNIGNREALLALLELVANESLIKKERELALKCVQDIVKSGP